MVSAFIKVRNTDFRWVKSTLFQSIQKKYRIRIILDTVNRLEFSIESSSVWSKNIAKMIIYSDEKRAGMVNLSIGSINGAYTSRTDKFAVDAWEAAAEILRFSLAGEKPTEKCWNCFEEKDFRDNFCQNCGKG